MKKKLSEIQPGERFYIDPSGLVEHMMVGECKGGWAVQKTSCSPYSLVLFGGPNIEYEIIPPIPEAKYRPFANAAEFEPHRNRWVQRNGSTLYRIVSYEDRVFSLDNGSYSWSSGMEIFTFDNGSPFGVLEE